MEIKMVTIKDAIKFNDNMVKKYRCYANAVNKDGNNLGFVEYILKYYLNECINDTQQYLDILRKLK